MDKLQTEFEAWAVKYKGDHNLPLFTFFKDVHGQYICLDCRVAWESWKAARESLCVELPRVWNEEHDEYRNRLVDELDEAGVRYK